MIRRIAAVNPNTVVVLYNGSPVEMPWIGCVKAVVEGYLGGQAVGGATKLVLWGEVNPCGRLPETFPHKLEDNPSYLTYGGEGGAGCHKVGWSQAWMINFFARFKTKVPLKNTLVVGDQIFTDILGAHVAGMQAAMVMPLYHEEGKGFDIKRDFEQKYIDLYLEEHGEFL